MGKCEADNDLVVRAKDAGDLARAADSLDELRTGLDAALEAGTLMLPLATTQQPEQERHDIFVNSPAIGLGFVDVLPFPTTAFPHWSQRMIVDVATSTQTMSDMPGMLHLGAISSLVAFHYCVEVNSTYCEPLITQVMVALEPGNAKSAVHSMMFAPHREYEKEEAQRRAPMVNMARSQLHILQQLVADNEHQAVKKCGDERQVHLATIEAAHNSMRELGPMEHFRLLVEDATPERLAQLVAEFGTLAVISSEGGGVLASLTRYASKKRLAAD